MSRRNIKKLPIYYRDESFLVLDLNDGDCGAVVGDRDDSDCYWNYCYSVVLAVAENFSCFSCGGFETIF